MEEGRVGTHTHKRTLTGLLSKTSGVCLDPSEANRTNGMLERSVLGQRWSDGSVSVPDNKTCQKRSSRPAVNCWKGS